MTVVASQGRISWKFSIPAIASLLGLIVAVWLLPLPSGYPDLMLSGVPPAILRILGTIGTIILILGLAIWTTWGDEERS